MMFWIRWFSFIVLGSFSLSGFGSAVYVLQSSSEPYIQFVVPKEVFTFAALRQGDYGLSLSHFSIVDNQGQPLPYAIFRQPRPELTKQSEITQFPVYRVEDRIVEPIQQKGTEIHIQGNRIDISTAADVTQSSIGKNIYLIDVRNLDKNIDALQVDWLEEGGAIKQWQLEASVDFQRWTSLGQYNLVKTQNADTQLVQNTISVNLSPKQYQFLRLTPVGDHSESITRIQGLSHSLQSLAPVKEEHWSIEGNSLGLQASASRYRTDKVHAWEFTRNEQIPAVSLALNLGNFTYAGNASFYAKQEEKDSWRPVYSGYWMNAQVGSQWKTSAPIELQNNAIRFWRVELDETAKLQSVSLGFSWEPLIVRAITNNKAPFHIEDQSPNSVDPQKLYHQLIGTESRVWVDITLTQTAARSFVAEPEKKNWSLWLFWIGMFTVVIVLAAFSLKLLKQIQMKSN